MEATATKRGRGRPRIHEDDVLLEAAFRAFAADGYEGMSVRTVATELGLSHGALNRRFGSKWNIFEAAITHGFANMIAAMQAERAARQAPADDLAAVRELIRSFMVVNEPRPEFCQLMNMEGLRRTPQLELILQQSLGTLVPDFSALLRRLEAAGVIYPISMRALFFLVAHGAEAAFSLTGISSYFDKLDGHLDAQAHIEDMTDLIMRGITR
ncbi:TetR family transcriptional regulator [Mycolicibacterium sp.]|uniref:TetR/AcrR family transcriptional regulator n=1 Tax=Mycolicibacterium sp. TaxID=2320850 RepID=UPI001A2B472C|nr:TetR family transcriptional regulator [Mycolicibacterium sp.]MBJ7399323.1 TetR family transcriptional regulator [Mycolicibacterium sp.]